MRGDFYVWSDGENLHLHDQRCDGKPLVIPDETFEELAAMYFLRMTESERESAIRRAYENHGGNFGCEGVAKYLGQPSGYDLVGAMNPHPHGKPPILDSDGRCAICGEDV